MFIIFRVVVACIFGLGSFGWGCPKSHLPANLCHCSRGETNSNNVFSTIMIYYLNVQRWITIKRNYKTTAFSILYTTSLLYIQYNYNYCHSIVFAVFRSQNRCSPELHRKPSPVRFNPVGQHTIQLYRVTQVMCVPTTVIVYYDFFLVKIWLKFPLPSSCIVYIYMESFSRFNDIVHNVFKMYTNVSS